MLFVIAYDRNSGKLVVFERFEDAERSSAEALFRSTLSTAMAGNEGTEVNIFEAQTEDVFRKTHARYFQTTKETLDAMRRAI